MGVSDHDRYRDFPDSAFRVRPTRSLTSFRPSRTTPYLRARPKYFRHDRQQLSGVARVVGALGALSTQSDGHALLAFPLPVATEVDRLYVYYLCVWSPHPIRVGVPLAFGLADLLSTFSLNSSFKNLIFSHFRPVHLI